jgi:hypothetical protein
MSIVEEIRTMTHSNDDFTPETIDEQIKHFLQLQELQQQAPSAALTQALKAICEEDAASLEHVWERYAARLQALPASSTPSLTNVSLSFLQKKELTMHDLQEKKEPLFIQPSVQRKTGWEQRLGVFAAILCTMVLVGGFLTIVNAARMNRTTSVGSHIEITPTPQPIARPASHAIPKAVLTAAPTGNGEGIGPGLSGITATNHFTVGQQFWLFFLVNDDGGGTVTVKWYANSRLFSSSSQYISPVPMVSSRGGVPPTPAPQRTPTPVPTASVPPTPGPTASPVPIESNFSTTYDQPAAGKVELYWKGQLAMTLFFVVKPKA